MPKNFKSGESYLLFFVIMAANPKSKEARQAYIDNKPFEGFVIDDNSILTKLQGRNPCPSCGKSRKFFCYTCYVPIKLLEDILPTVKLPIKIDIIKHKNEIDGKSTSGHAAILAHEDVSVYTYPDIPSYTNEEAVLIFPSYYAITVSQLTSVDTYEKCKRLRNTVAELPHGINRTTLMKNTTQSGNIFDVCRNRNLPITKAVFIDSTWNQSKGIFKDERLNSIPCVVIENRISQFWRHQKGSPRWYLATIEAIHQFLIEIHIYTWGLNPSYRGIYNCFTEKCLSDFESLYTDSDRAYNGQYDNLLFFFQHMYDLIHTYYDHEDLYAYKRRLK